MNTVTISTTLAIAITCMIIGFVTGGFIGYFNKDKRKKKTEELPEQASSAAGPSVVPLADPAKFTELLHLWRGKDGNGLFVETSGHLLASSQPLNSVQKRRFLDLIKELAVWLELPLEEAIPIQAAVPLSVSDQESFAKPSHEMPDQPVKEPLIKASEQVKTDPLKQNIPPEPIPAVIPVQPSKPPVVARPQINGVPVVEPAKKPAGSMVEQIDDILQEIIKASDHPTRRVKLVEEKQDGVIVWVEQEHFIGIDAVTDQSAKDLIRAAVKEWDRRTEIRM
jgi:hypothetical protein